ncbi:MAG: rhomboid family intramembrane serine protease [Candidatus Bathyarchaeota archaeon]|nr:rhomboid family intramembrane serine protease [Candidatus Bathyarchaeum sp.]
MASKFAVFSYLLIVVNIVVFIQSILDPEAYNVLITTYGLVPVQVTNGENLLSLVTSMFLHADILHLGMNMLFLLLSGDVVERELGNFRFLGLYLACGVIAGHFYSYLNAASTIPTIGASGAIFGILAVLAIRVPFRWMFKLFGLIPIPLPAILFVFLTVLTETAYVSSGIVENVAHTAHIGGFLAGLFLTLLFMSKKKKTKE